MCHPQEARKFVFASKLSRDQSCILVSITIPNFIDCKFFGDSDLENGLCEEIHGQTTILPLRLTTRFLGERVIVVGGLPVPRVQMVH